jgi:hypothetical protein
MFKNSINPKRTILRTNSKLFINLIRFDESNSINFQGRRKVQRHNKQDLYIYRIICYYIKQLHNNLTIFQTSY